MAQNQFYSAVQQLFERAADQLELPQGLRDRLSMGRSSFNASNFTDW